MAKMNNQIELIYGIFEFVNDNRIIVNKLAGFERTSMDRVNEIDDNINVASENREYDSCAYRSDSSPETTLVFISARDYLTAYRHYPKYFKLELCAESCQPTTPQDVKDKIAALYAQYVEENEEDPRFAEVYIQYPDENPCAACIKMSSDCCDEEEDYIFYFCDSAKDLQSLCEEDSIEEFRVIDITCFFDSL